jgi:hypothetical protein
LAEVSADLLGAPPPKQQLGDHAPEEVVGLDPASVRPCSTLCGTPVSIKGPIPTSGCCVAP